MEPQTERDKYEKSLECPVCWVICPPPTTQCRNGHLICASCLSNPTITKCPLCSVNYSNKKQLSRNLFLENCAQVSGIKCNCPFSGCGCAKLLEYDLAKIREHTQICKFRKIKCPACGLMVPINNFENHCNNYIGEKCICPHISITLHDDGHMVIDSKYRKLFTDNLFRGKFLVHMKMANTVEVVFVFEYLSNTKTVYCRALTKHPSENQVLKYYIHYKKKDSLPMEFCAFVPKIDCDSKYEKNTGICFQVPGLEPTDEFYFKIENVNVDHSILAITEENKKLFM